MIDYGKQIINAESLELLVCQANRQWRLRKCSAGCRFNQSQISGDEIHQKVEGVQ